jgi:predicted nucleic acid-binding protein
MILLDTNVIAALMRDRPEEPVVRWLDRQPRTSIWTTSISVYETRFGLQIMPEGRRRSAMMALFERLLETAIQGRVATFDHTAAQHAADLAAERHWRGRLTGDRDTMIASIVLANHATLATRNVRHFEELAGAVVNPWGEGKE